jgi:hypothetical protein
MPPIVSAIEEYKSRPTTEQQQLQPAQWAY